MRRVNQNQFIAFHGQFNLLTKDNRLVAGVLIKANFADAENVRLVEEFREQGDYFAAERYILSLFGINAHPCVVLDTVIGSAFRFELGKVAKVIAEALSRAAIESSPKRRLTNRNTATACQAFVIVGNA